MLLVNGHTTGVKEKLDAVEEALQEAQSRQPTPNEPADAKTRNLIGQIATARATLALTHYDTETMLAQSQRALEFLGSERVSTRANAYWTLGYAYLNRKDFVAAHQAFAEAIALSQSIGATFTVILATIGLGLVQEAENQLHRAAQTYRHVLQLAGDQPLQIIAEAHLGLARVLYEWNDLAGAQHHGEQSLQLARQYDRVIDRFIVGEVFLARLKLARGDVSGAADALAQSYQTARQRNFVLRLPEVAAAQVITLLRQGLTAEAMQLVQTHDLPLCRAQICLAQGDAPAALAILENSHQHAQAQTWTNEWLSIAVLQAAALHMRGKRDEAIQRLGEVLKLAEPEGFIRLFVDLGSPMKSLLAEAAAHGQMPIYVGKLRAAFEAEPQPIEGDHSDSPVEPLSQRELEVLRLIAQGLSNNEIGERLFLALDTVKGHNRKIFEKLQVQRRTEAVAIARKLGLL
jgi:LuxR family maltose regulon positive regulatory protein